MKCVHGIRVDQRCPDCEGEMERGQHRGFATPRATASAETPEQRARDACLTISGGYRFGRDLQAHVAAAIREAVAAEREACAKIGDVVVLSMDYAATQFPPSETEKIIKRTGAHIATAIRERRP